MLFTLSKNGQQFCENNLDAEVTNDKATCQAPVHVRRGETVYVSVRHDAVGNLEVEGRFLCAFSGFLISADSA
jgi:hypothetical protein